MILFTIYGLFSIISFLSSVRDGYEAKYIFEDKLGISARKLEGGAVEWNDIVQKILTLQKSGEYRVAIHEKDIKDELMIAQRILRRENFMIAFFNANMLDLTIPLPWPLGVAGRSTTRFYSKSLEVSCVFSDFLFFIDFL
jgi:autophagy-related protein 9